jgi:hypothetical protein
MRCGEFVSGSINGIYVNVGICWYIAGKFFANESTETTKLALIL